MQEALLIDIKYNIKHGHFDVRSNIKKDKIADFVTDFLHNEVGQGADESETEKRDDYRIKIAMSFNDDCYWCWHDCGNKGLRNGILMRFVSEPDLSVHEYEEFIKEEEFKL